MLECDKAQKSVPSPRRCVEAVKTASSVVAPAISPPGQFRSQFCFYEGNLTSYHQQSIVSNFNRIEEKHVRTKSALIRSQTIFET